MTGTTKNGDAIKLPSFNLNTIVGILLLLVNVGIGYFISDVKSGQSETNSKIDKLTEKVISNGEADARQQTDIELLKQRDILEKEFRDEVESDGELTVKDVQRIFKELYGSGRSQGQSNKDTLSNK